MTHQEFDQLSAELLEIAPRIPLKWGAVQNDLYDSKVKMFCCNSFAELESALQPFGQDIRQYYHRRWFLWKCSQCDEYLFCENVNVEQNPNPCDQRWDVKIDGKDLFDIKGSKIPFELSRDVDGLIANPMPLIEFFYRRQSTGVRHCNQNRLFVVHHSFLSAQRENIVRCDWGIKRIAYADFCANLKNVKKYASNGCSATVVFILEREAGKTEYIIPR